MNWKKRSEFEIELSVSQKDYTGGYEFYPWLWHMRKMYLLGFFGNMSIGIGSLVSSWPDPIGIGLGIFFGVFAPCLIGFLLRRDYKRLKVGQSS